MSAPNNGLSAHIAVGVVDSLAIEVRLLAPGFGSSNGLQETTSALRSGDSFELMLVVELSTVEDLAVIVLTNTFFAEIEVDAG